MSLTLARCDCGARFIGWERDDFDRTITLARCPECFSRAPEWARVNPHRLKVDGWARL